jgi:hypothetical protein
MNSINWAKETPFAITVSDKDGNILLMNDKSVKTFEKYGGINLIGASLFNCHPPMASNKLRDMLVNHNINAYTIEKEGLKKMIYQSPWFENGEFMGYIELSLVLPNDMPHFVRK